MPEFIPGCWLHLHIGLKYGDIHQSVRIQLQLLEFTG